MEFEEKLIIDVDYAREVYGCKKNLKGKVCNKMIWEKHTHSFQGQTPPSWFCRWWIKIERQKTNGRPKHMDLSYSTYQEFPDFDDPIPIQYFEDNTKN